MDRTQTNDYYAPEETQETEPYTKGGISMSGQSTVMPAAIIAIALIIIGFMGYIVSNRYVQSQAVAACVAASRVQAPNSAGVTINGPEDTWFTRCLDRSGIEE